MQNKTRLELADYEAVSARPFPDPVTAFAIDLENARLHKVLRLSGCFVKKGLIKRRWTEPRRSKEFIYLFFTFRFEFLILVLLSILRGFPSQFAVSSLQQENLARLQRAFARKWEFIYMQAEAQVK